MTKIKNNPFDMGNQKFDTPEDNGPSDRFNPVPKKGINGVYKATIRFVPFLKDKSKSLITKYCSYLEDPVSKESMTVDSYRSIGKSDICPIKQTFFKCYYSDDATIKQYEDMFKQRENHWSLIQILEDVQAPETVGKIFYWKFGYKIKQKFDQEANPSKGKRRDPFDIFEGRPMQIEVYEKGGYNNYDNCQFFDPEEGEYSLLIDGKPLTEDSDLNEAAEWVIANSPDMTRFEFQEWDQETTDFVNLVINNLFNGTSSGQYQGKLNVSTTDDVDDVDDDYTDSISKDLDRDIKASKQKSATPPASTAKKKAAIVEDDDDDDGDIFDSVSIDDVDLDDL